MKYFGSMIFGILALAVTAGVLVLTHRMALAGKGGGIMAVLMSPILWLVFAGPCGLLFLVFLFRSFKK